MGSQRTPSESENRCKARFEQWLRAHNLCNHVVWCFEPEGHTTSPDFRLTMDGQEYAVEVAIVMRSERVGDRVMSSVLVWNSLRGFLKILERELQTRGVLAGAYVVEFPEPIVDFSKHRQHLRLQITDYVCATQGDAKSPQVELTSQAGVVLCKIGKYNNRSSYIRMSGLGFGGGEPEIYADLCPLIKAEIDDKAHSLRNETRPRILLLHDMYGLGSPYMWQECVTAHDLLNNFHTIFVVNGVEDYAVYTKEATWPILDADSFFAVTGWSGDWPDRNEQPM